jgi:hypothetical protein
MLSRSRMLPAWSRPVVPLWLLLSFARAISRCAATTAPFVGSLHRHQHVHGFQLSDHTIKCLSIELFS